MLIVLGLVALHTFASSPVTAAHPSTAFDSVPALARFLNGEWKCLGGNPAGKVLVSDVGFTLRLGDRFIESSHRDLPPGPYASIAFWPTQIQGALSMLVYDNFGGSRRFVSRAWTADSIVWARDTTEHSARPETFTYRRVDDRTYWYAWHVRRAETGPLILGEDSATCTHK